jgi:iron(III) transport system ATP-binding protein
MTEALDCHNLSKAFNGKVVLEDVTLNVQAGEFLTLLGPSGCGKTTTLRLIAGFEWPDSGTIDINGKPVANGTVRVPPEERRVGMVFQEYALFPHLDVADNIAFGLQGTKDKKQRRVDELLAFVGLTGLGERRPHELSGGQQQRIALARALAPKPTILLLDEPFSNLDATLRAQVRSEVRTILKQAGITCVFVTHDQEEALSLADKIAVIFDGKTAQVGDPQQTYQHPNSREVAAFVGEANFLPAEASGDVAACALGDIPLIEPMQGAVDLLIRPEMIRLTPDQRGGGVVLWREFYGHDQRIGVLLVGAARTLVVRANASSTFSGGQRVRVDLRSDTRGVAFPRE